MGATSQAPPADSTVSRHGAVVPDGPAAPGGNSDATVVFPRQDPGQPTAVQAGHPTNPGGPTFAAPPGAPFDQLSQPPASTKRFLLLGAAVIVVLGGVAAFLFLRSDGDEATRSTDDVGVVDPSTPDDTNVDDDVVPIVTEETSTTTTTSTTSTTTTTTTTTTTVPAETTTLPPETTIPETTLPPETTVPETTAPPPPPPPQLWDLPAIPTEGPTSGPGTPLIVAEVLPSGVAAATVQGPFLNVQALVDAQASGDWATARLLDAVPLPTDADYVNAYGQLDRASLILADALPSGESWEFAVIEMDLEAGAVRTRIRCTQFAADGFNPISFRRGSFELELWDGNILPEALRNDEPLLTGLRSRCTFAALAPVLPAG